MVTVDLKFFTMEEEKRKPLPETDVLPRERDGVLVSGRHSALAGNAIVVTVTLTCEMGGSIMMNRVMSGCGACLALVACLGFVIPTDAWAAKSKKSATAKVKKSGTPAVAPAMTVIPALDADAIVIPQEIPTLNLTIDRQVMDRYLSGDMKPSRTMSQRPVVLTIPLKGVTNVRPLGTKGAPNSACGCLEKDDVVIIQNPSDMPPGLSVQEKAAWQHVRAMGRAAACYGYSKVVNPVDHLPAWISTNAMTPTVDGVGSTGCVKIATVVAAIAPRAVDVDTDGGTVFDKDDQCRTIHKGPNPDPSRPGCPDGDRDGDTIPDHSDACPDKAGVSNVDPKLNGCPLPLPTPTASPVVNTPPAALVPTPTPVIAPVPELKPTLAVTPVPTKNEWVALLIPGISFGTMPTQTSIDRTYGSFDLGASLGLHVRNAAKKTDIIIDVTAGWNKQFLRRGEESRSVAFQACAGAARMLRGRAEVGGLGCFVMTRTTVDEGGYFSNLGAAALLHAGFYLGPIEFKIDAGPVVVRAVQPGYSPLANNPGVELGGFVRFGIGGVLPLG